MEQVDKEVQAENQERSNSSSFEDLSNEGKEIRSDTVKDEQDQPLDILGNGQLLKKIIKKGHPDERPTRLNLAKVNILGKLENGTVVEDFRDLTVQVGDFEVVQGVDMAIPLMDVGETCELHVDARFAYGSIGHKSATQNIPPDSKIIYTIDLLAYKIEGEVSEKSYETLKKIGNLKRERGNFWFERQEYNISIQCYRRSLEYLDDTEGGITKPTADGNIEPTNAELQDLLEDRLKVYNNLAQAQMKVGAYDTALKSVDTVLTCQPNNVKAIFRKAKIMEAKVDISTAINLLRKAATLEPDNKGIQNELSRLILKSKKEARNEKDMYQKMLGHAQKLEQKTKKPITSNQSKQEPSKFKLWGYLMGSILVGVAGVAFYRYKYL